MWPVVCVCREKPTYERRQDISLEDFENEPEDTVLPCFWHWSKLSREQKAHAQVLEYDSESWYDDEYRNMTWVMVMKQPHLRLAALALGFTAATWQAHPDLTSDSTLEKILISFRAWNQQRLSLQVQCDFFHTPDAILTDA